MIIILKFIKKYKKYYSKINCFFDDISFNEFSYISTSIMKKISRKYKNLYLFFNHNLKNKKIKKFLKDYKNIENIIINHNNNFFKDQLTSFENMLNNIDGKSLDYQQKQVVLCDDKNTLVIAGAGSGKTLTISGKVKYLIESKKAKVEEILLISFTDKAVKEMTSRLKRIGIDVVSKTFHKLGLEIITNFKQSRPQIATTEFINNIFEKYFKKEILNFPEEIKNILEFMSVFLYIPEDISDFENFGEYIDNFRNIDYESIENKYLKAIYPNYKIQKVRRLDDLIIANFLFLNGIKYKYDYMYPFKANNSFKSKINCNFYFPEYNIYLEHFSIDENGRSKFLTKFEEQKYLSEIDLKRTMHKIHKTKLIETYSYYNKNKLLIPKLKNELLKNNINLKTINIKEIYSKIYIENKDNQFEEFIKLISTFLSLFKSNNFQITDLDKILKENEKVSNKFLKNRNILFLKIFKNFYSFYQNSLLESGNIDFNDIINNSTEIAKLGFIPNNYKYIIIDEYQDISVSRFKLIKAIQNLTNAKVMCVGDDWQSIYRFSGSDIDLFTNFEKYFGPSNFQKIEKTYRNSQELIDIASNFVTQNPSQITKDLKSNKHIENPIKLISYKENISNALKEAIDDIISNFDENSEILLLGRTKYDISKIFENNNLFESNEDYSEIKYLPNTNIKISFMTVHKSKGLEADNVIIINMENSLLGFPNRISNDPVLSLVLNNSEEYPYSEERRLFYVAITRTKNRTYLLVPENHYSSFITELLDNNLIKKDNDTKLNISNKPKCLKCKSGFLIIRKNSENGKEFLGCTNYPQCNFTLNDINILQNTILCEKCGGYIVEKSGKSGNFYACSNYPLCKKIYKK